MSMVIKRCECFLLQMCMLNIVSGKKCLIQLTLSINLTFSLNSMPDFTLFMSIAVLK